MGFGVTRDGRREIAAAPFEHDRRIGDGTVQRQANGEEPHAAAGAEHFSRNAGALIASHRAAAGPAVRIEHMPVVRDVRWVEADPGYGGARAMHKGFPGRPEEPSGLVPGARLATGGTPGWAAGWRGIGSSFGHLSSPGICHRGF